MKTAGYQSFEAFYPDYLHAHRNRANRRLHFVGTTLVILLLPTLLLAQAWAWLWLLPVAGYGPAWLGHFLFEKNRPATFSHPWLSLRGDFRMYTDLWRGRLPF